MGIEAIAHGIVRKARLAKRQQRKDRARAAAKTRTRNPGTGGRTGFVSRVARVTRRTTRRVHPRRRVQKKSYNSNVNGSTFVKCTDAKLPDVKRYITPFERKIMMATLPQYGLRVFNSEFSFMCKAGPWGNPSSKGQIVGWTQLAINALNPTSLYTTSGSSSGINRLICSSFHSDLVTNADPWGIHRQGYVWSGSNNSNIDYLPPTLYASFSNMLASATGEYNQYIAGSNARIWQGDTYSTLEMRNPQQFGMRVNIYEVGSRSKQENYHVSTTAVGSAASTYNLPNCGTPAFSNASIDVDYQKSPLETFVMGMARKGVAQSAVANSRLVGLNDSPDFVDQFRTYKVCSVYIPPGGTLYKHYKIRSRVVDYTHIQRNSYDRSTKFLIIKVVPEIQALPRATVTGTVIGVDNQPGDTSAYWYESSIADPHLICTLTQRLSSRLLPSTLRSDTYIQNGWIPSGAGYNEGRSVGQNNDIGSKTLTGVNKV